MPLPTRAKEAAARREPSRCAAPFARARTSSASWSGPRGCGGAAVVEVFPEGFAPGTRRDAGEALIQCGVEDRPAGAPRRSSELRRENRTHEDVRVALARHCLRDELVPCGFSRVREVYDPPDLLLDELADRPRDVGRECGPPDLVVHDRKITRPALDLFQNRIHDVHAAHTEDPGGPHDEHVAALLESPPLSHQLGAAVGVDRVHGVVLAIGPYPLTRENVVGRDVHECRVELAAERRERSHRDDIDDHMLRIGFRRVDARVGGGVQDDARVGAESRPDSGGVRDVEGRASKPLGIRELASERPPEHSTGSEDDCLHERTSLHGDRARYLRSGIAKGSFVPAVVFPSSTYATPTTAQSVVTFFNRIEATCTSTVIPYVSLRRFF